MAINLGTATPSAYYLGATTVSKLYLGETQVWPEGTPPPSSDPYWQYVTLLLHADGSGGSFVDSSPYPHTLAASGVVQSTTNERAAWGGSSAYINGNGYRITTTDAPEWWLANFDYVVEAWLFIPTLNTRGGGYFFSQMMNVSDNANRQVSFAANSGGLQVYWTKNGVSDNIQVFSTSLPIGQWFHAAFVRSSNTLRAYVDGAQVGSTVSHTATYYDSTASVCIGSFGQYATNGYSYLDFIGYIDDLRITRGSDRGYPSGFTKPTAAFPDTGTLPSSKLAIGRTSGASSFQGNGVFSKPFYRTGSYMSGSADTLTSYAFTANASGTVYVKFAWSDPDDNYPTVTISKKTTSSASAVAVATYTSQGLYTATVSVVAGNVLIFTTTDEYGSTDFYNVEMYAI